MFRFPARGVRCTWTLLLVCAGILCLSGSAFAQATSITSMGFRANEGGGGGLTTEYTTGNLGNTWSEGEWVPYQLIIENVQTSYPGLVGFPNIVMSYDFTGGGDKRFVDLVRSIQAGTSGLSDAQGWPRDDGSPYPMGTRALIEQAQNDFGNTGDLENIWPGFANLNLPDSQMNRFRTGPTTFTDGSPTDAEHTFYITLQDLLDAGIPTDADSIVIYYQLHESRSFVWQNSLQEQYDQSPTDGWGGYLYSLPAYAADARLASGYVPGSSGHIEVEFASGAKTVPIPIPETLPGQVSGLKWLDHNGDGIMDGGEPTLSGWRIYVSGTLEGISFSDTTLTDGSGNYSFPNLTSGTIWHVREDAQRYSPSESGYMQTYPSNGSALGVGTGFDWGPSAPLADVGWDVALTVAVSSQGDMNFGNKLCAPSLICPPNITVGCTESTAPSNTGSPTVDVNCPDYTLNYYDSETPGNCPQEKTIERMWIVVDAAGIADTCIQTITVQDNTPPVITCAPDKTFECDNVGDFGTPTATDDCDDVVDITLINRDSTATCGDGYVLVLTYEAMDDCGNADTCSQTITVQDTTPPVITCATDKTFECDNVGDFGTPSATDNCDNDVDINLIGRDSTATCGDGYVLVLTYEAMDNCGNADTCSQTITVQDTTPPVLTCAPDKTFECDNVGDFGSPSATDNCDTDVDITLLSRDSTHTCGNSYVLVLTYEAMDNCGNADTCSQTITVQDTTPPVITCAPDKTFECDNVGDFGSPSATDNCDLDVDINLIGRDSTHTCGNSYVLVLTYEAVDDCGNADTCSQTITVQDTTPPVVVCPPDTTFDCSYGDGGVATATDNCDPDPAITFVDDTTSTSCPLRIVRTWIATDACGNADSCDQVLVVDDTEAPVLTCASDKTFECDNVGDFGSPSAIDNCDANPRISLIGRDSTATCGDGYVLVLTYEAQDACGNADTCSQTITVQDTTPPVITCAPDKTFECDNVGDFGSPSATDNCDTDVDINLIGRDSTHTCGNSYVLVLTYEAMDNCGNADTCSQTITVQDTTPPVITCAEDKRFECDNVGDFGSPSATDNCDPDPAITEIGRDSTATCGDGYVLVLTFEAMDNCGNADTCSQTITVEDTTPPVITCAPDKRFECDAVGDFGSPSATDNCDDDVDINLIGRDSTHTCGNSYVLVLTYEAMDNCGNADTCSQTITVEDTTPPVITCAPDKRFECDNVGDFGSPSATDNCDTDVDINNIGRDSTATCGDGYVLVLTFEAIDDCGNADTCSQTITVEDTTPPVITCAPDKRFECDNVGDFGSPSATDNCDNDVDINLIGRDSTATCGSGYVLVLTYEAMDNCGNADTCSQTITVEDTTPPVITCAPDKRFECDNVGDFGSPSATDNCDPNPSINLIGRDSTANCGSGYVLVLTYEAVDDCGNADTCSQTITVEDTTPPVITCAPDDSVECDGLVVFTPPSASDNCDPNPTINELRTDTVAGPGDGEFTYTRYWEAVDVCGNTSFECSQSIIRLACPNEFCTYTVGGWGTDCPESQWDDPLSTQPGCILVHYFDEVFPSGVTIGDPNGLDGGPYWAAKWTSAAAVAAYLPNGGTPSVLTSDLTNPIWTPAGNTAAQVLALTLNVEFSCAGVFSGLGDGEVGCLGEYIIPDSCSSKFAGLTVDSFLVIANKALSGNTGVLAAFGNAKISQVSGTAECLNRRFDNCFNPLVYTALLAYSEYGFAAGDVNGDGQANVTDVVMLINIVLRGGEGLSAACDVNHDCYGTTADIISLVNIVLKGGSASSGE